MGWLRGSPRRADEELTDGLMIIVLEQSLTGCLIKLTQLTDGLWRLTDGPMINGDERPSAGRLWSSRMGS